MTPTLAEVRVAVLGASPKPERYSNMAVRRLKDQGYTVIPVNSAVTEIEGLPVARTLAEITQPIHTITVYLSAAHSTPLIPQIVAAHPRRVILNPGAENAALTAAARNAGIEVLQACTLVMLTTGQF